MSDEDLTDEKTGTLNYNYVLNKAILDVMKANREIFSPKGEAGPKVTKEEARGFKNTVYLLDVISIPWTAGENTGQPPTEYDESEKVGLDFPERRVAYINECLEWFKKIIKALDAKGALIEHSESLEI